jgi:hypothetical protein
MAREAYPVQTPVTDAARYAYAAGVSDERARVAAWLREFAVHSHLANILADELKGKAHASSPPSPSDPPDCTCPQAVTGVACTKHPVSPG